MKHKFLLFLTLAFLLIFCLPAPVAAADNGIFYGDTIPAGTVVEHDVVLYGQNVSVNGTVDGNVFILGNQVLVNGTVNGSLVLIAQNASIGGDVSGAVYALALTLDLPTRARLERDLYSAAVSLTSGQDSTISRHLYALGLDSGLNGKVGGDLHTVIGPIQLYNGLMHLLGFDELTLQLHIEIPPPQPAPQGRVVGQHLRLKLMEPLPAFDWARWGLGLLRTWAVLFIFGLLAYWLARKPLARSGEPLKRRPWQTLGIGLVVLVVSLNLFVVALLLIAIVFAIGLGFNFLGLWPVAVALWVVAYTVLLVAMVALWFFIAYGTKIIVAYMVASWLFGKVIRLKTWWLDLLALLAGTVVYALLRTLPYVGWVFDLLVIAAGMGSAWMAYRSMTAKPQAVIPVEEKPVIKPARGPVGKKRLPGKAIG